jgi:plastocyanin
MNQRRRFLKVAVAAGFASILAPRSAFARWWRRCRPQPCCCPIPSLAASVVTVQAGSDTKSEFVPAEITINRGGTVQWFNYDGGNHNVTTFNDPSFTPLNPPLSGIIRNQGDTYQYTFNNPGTYGYSCTNHPGDPVHKTGAMWGIIHVL